MLLGNKCDMDDKRVVPKGKGEQVRGTVEGGGRAPLRVHWVHWVAPPGLPERALWKQRSLTP